MERATLVHRSAGRFRVRVPGRRGDEAWLANVEARLREHPSVRDVSTSARTGSIVVQHAGTREAVEAFARERELFEIVGAPLRTSADRLAEELQELHEGLRAGSPEQKMKAVVFYSLLGGVALQIARGKFLPAGEALLLQALSVLSRKVSADGGGTLVDGGEPREAPRPERRPETIPDGRH